MIRLKELLNELEFASQKEFDAYSKKHDLRPSTKVKVAGKQTTAGLASLRRGLPDKPAGKNIFADKANQTEKSKKDIPAAELKKTDDKLYATVS